jgi:hypothetical protein
MLWMTADCRYDLCKSGADRVRASQPRVLRFLDDVKF